MDDTRIFEALDYTLTSNLTEDTWKDKMLIENGHEVTNVVALINPKSFKS